MNNTRSRRMSWLIGMILLGGLAGILWTTHPHWEPLLNQFRSPIASSVSAVDEPAGHDSEHHDHDSPKNISLSDRARQNLGLKLGKIELKDWWQTISIPADVIEEPGHSEQAVSTNVQGIVLKIYAFPGQTVRAGDPLVDIQPTGDLLANAESSLLNTLQEIDLVQQQLQRITPTVESGATPVMRKIEKEYELTRLNSQRLVQVQELLVRGLSPTQVDEIIASKKLIRKVTVRVPAGALPGEDVLSSGPTADEGEEHDNDPQAHPIAMGGHEHGSVYSVETLTTYLGQLVLPGTELCRLARHSHLLLAGRAFERESHLVNRAIEENWPVKAIFETSGDTPQVRENLSILYSDNVIDTSSNTIRFYVPLANEILRDSTGANGLPYRAWRFRPGQKVQLLVPVNHLTRRIVLPAEAVVKEGGDAYVFRANGKLLERVAVHLESLDSREAVLANDRALFPGDFVAMNQAYQLDLALRKSQSGSGQGHGHSHEGHSH